MSTGRTPKRARKKERRDVRREAIRHAVLRRRRQRLILLASSLAVIGGGVLIVLFMQDEGTDRPAATASAPGSAPVPTPSPVACGAELPDSAGSKKLTYPRAEEQRLEKDKTHTLRLETSCGDIDIELAVAESPSTSNSVAYLVRQGFYDGMFFHRIVPGFVVQGGDPSGDGTGGAGYDIVEPPPDDFKYTEGVVAMAKGGNDPPGSSSSQFFIVTGPEAADLPAEYAVLGKVVDGMDVVEKIEKLGRGETEPSAWAYIERAAITEG